MASFVKKLEDQKKEIQKTLYEVQKNIDSVKREDEKFTRLIKEAEAAGAAEILKMDEKLEIMQFIREKREEIDELKREMSRYN